MKRIYLLMATPLIWCATQAQVAVNSTGAAPDAKAMLDISATDKGLLPPRLTSEQRDQIAPPIPAGLMIYNTTTNCANMYNGSSWMEICGACTPQPTAADAGADQSNVAGTSTPLSANSPVNGSGSWSIVSGSGGSFSSSSDPEATFTGVGGNSYVLRWTITNVCATSQDDVSISFAQPFNCGDQITDADGNNYSTVLIGSQCWMQSNLKTTKYQNNDQIPEVTDNTTWDNLSSGALCYYNNNPSNAATYGAMYNWFAASDPRNICPSGWHLPSDAEWKTLEMQVGLTQGEADSFGMDRGSGIRVKLTTTSGWFNNANGNNSSGFSGAPGGWREGASFSNLTHGGYWWTSTPFDETRVIFRMLYYFYGGIARDYDLGFDQKTGMSVRCLKD